MATQNVSNIINSIEKANEQSYITWTVKIDIEFPEKFVHCYAYQILEEKRS